MRKEDIVQAQAADHVLSLLCHFLSYGAQECLRCVPMAVSADIEALKTPFDSNMINASQYAEDADVQASRADSLWGLAFAEQRKQQLSKLKMENEMLKRNEAILTTKLQSAVAQLEAENTRLRAELERAREVATAAPAAAPPMTVEDRLAALNWVVRSKSQPGLPSQG